MPNALMVLPLQSFPFARLSLVHLNIDLHMFMHILALHRQMFGSTTVRNTNGGIFCIV